MSSSATEEYLQAVYTLADETGSAIAARLAEFLRVSPPAVSEMLHRLERDGLISFDDRKVVHLTKEGRVAAESIVRRHRLSERFLVDMLGYPWWQTHEEAERIEHVLTPEMEQRLRRALGDPQACPHGNPMPGVAATPTRPLGTVAPGEDATIERIPDQFEHEPGFLEYLDGQGMRPGVRLRMIGRHDGLLRLRVGEDEHDVRSDCAEKVWVRA